MVTTKKRLEQIENALIALAGGGAGFAAGRMGAGPAAKAALRSPVGRAALAGFTYSQIREELNERDREVAEQEFGPLASRGLGVVQRLNPFPVPLAQAAKFGMDVAPKVRKKTKTRFNKMVSAGMKQAKANSSYGKKGTINNAKKAFSAVTKAASAAIGGKKLPKSGIKRKLMTAMRKIK